MSDIIATVSDFVCGYPLFILLIGGGLFLFIYSGFVPLRKFGASIKALGHKSDGEGQISSLQALMTTISSTVGMGNMAVVTIAICRGVPGASSWMWVSALRGMATKFFEGTLAIMYRGRDENGNVKGGPMYMMTEGVSPKLRPLAIFFAFFGMIGCFCVMQANQLTESITTVLTEPMGIATTLPVKLIIGVVMASLVAVVVVGGIDRISKLATKIVPFMVSVYFLLVLIVIVLYIDRLPGVFSQIVSSAFDFKAGFGAVAGIAIIGARRAMYVNEAGVGTASLMHGASKNSDPVREGLVAMLGPAIDSGLVCTLTAIPIIMAGNYEVEGVKGLAIALNSYEALLPGWGKYMLMVVVTFFAFSTMFSYSIYGIKCASYLFGDKNGQMYKYLYLAVILLSCVASLSTVVSIMDFAFAMMAFATMSTILYLSPRVKALLRTRQ